jgi:hypothetical protein
MPKHSRAWRARRKEQNEAVARIESAWQQSLPTDRMEAFEAAVAEARARGPLQPPPDMAPGTRPNPPRHGHEPKVKKEAATRSRRRW